MTDRPKRPFEQVIAIVPSTGMVDANGKVYSADEVQEILHSTGSFTGMRQEQNPDIPDAVDIVGTSSRRYN